MKARSRRPGPGIELEDDARRGFARELHDKAGQDLAALQINLTLLADSAQALDPRSRKMLKDSLNLSQTCVREIRELSSALYPPLLDEAGLATALRIHAGAYLQKTGVKLELDLPEAMDRIPQRAEITLFRVVQDALALLNPARGEVVRIRLERRPGWVSIHLAKPLAGRETRPERGDLIVASLRERIRSLAGRLNIRSGPDQAVVQARLPVAAPPDNRALHRMG